MLLLLLAQIAVAPHTQGVEVFQSLVDEAAIELNIPSPTVVEGVMSDPAPGAAYYPTNNIWIHPLVFINRAPWEAQRWMAYHEVCHIALRHDGGDKGRTDREIAANMCVLDHLMYANQKAQVFSKWRYSYFDGRNK